MQITLKERLNRVKSRMNVNTCMVYILYQRKCLVLFFYARTVVIGHTAAIRLVAGVNARNGYRKYKKC